MKNGTLDDLWLEVLSEIGHMEPVKEATSTMSLDDRLLTYESWARHWRELGTILDKFHTKMLSVLQDTSGILVDDRRGHYSPSSTSAPSTLFDEFLAPEIDVVVQMKREEGVSP